MEEKLKILILTQYFFPESFKSNDIAIELQGMGYKVDVLTGLPNYPGGSWFKGYSYKNIGYEYHNGIKIYRVPIVPRGRANSFRLFLNYLSFVISATIAILLLLIVNKKKYQAIIVHAPSPITQYIPSIFYKLFSPKTKILFWILDLWPESLQYVGNIKNKYIINTLHSLSKFFYRHSDNILISSKGFLKSMNRYNIDKSKIFYFPNWGEVELFASDNQIKSKFKFPKGFNVVFAGNIGVAQDIPNILKAAKIIDSINKNINIVFVGSGRMLPFIEKEIKNDQLHNVYTIGRVQLVEMPEIFKLSDILLLSLSKNEIFELTVPARLQAYMGASKAVVGMLDGEGHDIIIEAECGIAVPAEDPNALARAILKFADMDKETLKNFGNNGLKFYNNNFTKNIMIQRLKDILSHHEEIKLA